MSSKGQNYRSPRMKPLQTKPFVAFRNCCLTCSKVRSTDMCFEFEAELCRDERALPDNDALSLHHIRRFSAKQLV